MGLTAGDPNAHEQVVAEFDLAMAGATDVDRRQVGQYLDQRLTDERSTTETASTGPVQVAKAAKEAVKANEASEGSLEHRGEEVRAGASAVAGTAGGAGAEGGATPVTEQRFDDDPTPRSTSEAGQVNAQTAGITVGEVVPADVVEEVPGPYDRAGSLRQAVAHQSPGTGAAGTGIDEAVHARETAAAAFNRPTRSMLSEVADGGHRSAGPAAGVSSPLRSTLGHTYRP